MILFTGGDKPLGGWKMLFGPSDRYGDMNLEDVDEFEGLEPDNEEEIDPLGNFEHNEFRQFGEDFEEENLEDLQDYDTHYSEMGYVEEDEFEGEVDYDRS